MKTKKPSVKGAQLVIRLEEKDRLELEREAAKDQRKLADYVRKLILTHPERGKPRS